MESNFLFLFDYTTVKLKQLDHFNLKWETFAYKLFYEIYAFICDSQAIEKC